MLISEAVIEEARRVRLDLAARAPFAESGEEIYETRIVLQKIEEDQLPEDPDLAAAREASKLSAMDGFGWVEVE